MKTKTKRSNPEPKPFVRGTIVLTRDGLTRGVCTGASFRCRLAGCGGLRVTVRWPDGHYTFPCSKGLIWSAKQQAWRID